MSTILLVDDDRRATELLAGYLTDHGFVVHTAFDGKSGLEAALTGRFDAVILDVMMPVLDGIECLRTLRKTSDVPVVMLTAQGEELDRIIGLELGADDYLPKPYHPRELLARLRSVLRRTAGTHAAPVADEGRKVFEHFTLNLHRRCLEVDGNDVPLTSFEYALLEALIRNDGRVMTRDQLMDAARGDDYVALDRTIDVHITRLRQKLEPLPRKPRYIKTIWGSGYMFVGGRA